MVGMTTVGSSLISAVCSHLSCILLRSSADEGGYVKLGSFDVLGLNNDLGVDVVGEDPVGEKSRSGSEIFGDSECDGEGD